MNLDLPAPLRDLQQQTRPFVAEQVVPMARDPRQSPHGPADTLRRELVAKGRAAGLLSPQVGARFGGFGLDHRAKARSR